MGFALGAWWINTIAILLIHADRFVLLRYLDLATYGKYCIASTVVAAAYGLVFPSLYNALLPRLARPRLSRTESVGDMYRFAVQSSSAISALAYISWLLLANALISTWTGSATLGSEIAPVAVVLALGHSINALMVPAHALFMATGNSRPPAIASTILGIAFIPLLIYLCAIYGALGSAIAFLTMNAIYLVLGMWLVQSLLSRAEIAKMVLQDMVPVAVLVTVAHVLARHFGLPQGSGMNLMVPYVATCAISMTAILIMMPSLRRRLIECCVK
jgi:O-antigen/teichoic acid export membrane protein